MKEQLLLPYKNSTVSCLRFGSGPLPVICFHGYGEEAGGYEFLDKYAGNQFTFYSLDLPFHGQTVWKEGLVFSVNELQELVSLALAAGPEPQSPADKYILCGFSLGGRMALRLFEAAPGNVAKLVLMAPDGLKVNFWYWLVTQTWLGNKFFHFTMKHPGWFFGFLKMLNRFGLINASIFKFVNYYIGDVKVRDLLYTRWTSLRKIKPDLKKIKSLVQQHHTPVTLIYGKHDRIILSSVGEKFRKGIENDCTLQVIESGHQVLHEKHAAPIVQSLSA